MSRSSKVRAVDGIYCVYEFRLGNNVLVSSQLVFASRELVTKKQHQLATFTLFPLSLEVVQEAGDNGTEKLLITLDHVSCTNYFLSIQINWCGVRLIKIAKPDREKILWQKHIVSSQYDAIITRCQVTASDRGRFILIPRMQTSRAYEFMGVNPPSFPSIPPHSNAPLI